jgi:hypothetical protein
MDRPNDERNQAIPQASDTPSVRRSWSLPMTALGLILISALASMGLARLLKSPQEPSNRAEGKIPARLFQGWNKPDFVIVLSGQEEGYLMPCGCSYPQVGGLERRYNFIQLLKKEKGWPVVAVDLGDVPQTHKNTPAKLQNVQGLIKYRYSMMALKEMGYLAVGIGQNEAAGSWSLEKIEGEWAANAAQPGVLAGNLKDADSKFPFLKPYETQTAPGTNIKVGVTSSVGPTVAKTVTDPNVRFNIPSADHIKAQLQKMQKENVDLPILLYHGWPTGKKEALLCAQTFPDFPIILALTEEDEPPAAPIPVDTNSNTRNYVFQLGHKGKYIGVLGVYRNGVNFNFKYQLVKMDIDYDTPEDQKTNNRIARMLENYKLELKTKDYLKLYSQTSHVMQAMTPVPNLRNPGSGVPEYIGTEACKKCHDHAYEVWKNSKHSHAYQTLVDAKHPSLNQYDAECIVCHTVGFGYKTGFANEKDTKLINVGCESCHGPGSLHAKNPENQEWRDRMNQPWLDARRKGNVQAKNAAIEKFCVTCHDIDNDVHWVHKPNYDPFQDKWVQKKIIHNNPPE